LFPELWETEKAAEQWLGNNPLNPLISIIRLWVVIGAYRPRGLRGPWSGALVRHGADPGMALAAVLRVAPEDIQVREGARAGSQPLVTANTVPSPSPSNPNPNTAVVEPHAGAVQRKRATGCSIASYQDHSAPAKTQLPATRQLQKCPPVIGQRGLLSGRSPPFAPVRAQFASLSAQATIALRDAAEPAAPGSAPPYRPPPPSGAATGP
jgi:hypothetical protein